ncbi:lauroyl-Kdo(2)-lipid IV(A) myristoyltransferase [Bisgaard Taxon 10/6]|uniref:Lipid A biosynthesis acyltransferase n=2 Tax=Exercitatus varius TaxID=67857 RepID=A0AAW6QDD4_9PAST|nr:lauroyl-Kdo(2)-lipid IV(A) myristoyltransferase [Exercitatus varius]MDG2915199.1 lauroyl-Kdo(2)-lipid IV(A) myristoyltransferase [Exercitatus varius]MDG2940139.1 lauroyl-Kdo(2)-lipid IV(A) myristoyltransferase [Exercitatus varius]MDG2945506.1 lauroyl-Kdo(2)-lipid IV(A) myristoyltransferase [Exercitatus varius]MDG2950239.1 lauroyl-Kdo(2)-lipid IV(A) myristoyltransferase [Exercitatus varius]MDG2952967.1 lauroyl-Kdo(2)-lipid IV(A) myristoyltransferase [Exercitatus varius]
MVWLMAERENVRLTARVGYEPRFSWSYLQPKYWGTWLGVAVLLILAYVPFRWRDRLAAKLGIVIGRKARKQRRRAQINLAYCFPQWTEQQREQVIDKMFVTVTQVMLGIGEIAVRSKAHLQKRSEFIGIEHIKQAKAEGKNIILMVPHGWAIDASGIILHTHGMPMTSMFNPHRNPLIDWLWTATRERFGGKMHARQNGIKPFLTMIRNGDMGYYLPDEDFGAEASEFVDFFGTYKATLPGLNKMAKLAKAVVIPMFPRYNAESGKYEMEIHPPMELSDDPVQSARAMNAEIERFVTPQPEQYVWILQLLRTRKNGEDIYH